MDFKEYQAEALRTESKPPEDIKIDTFLLFLATQQMIIACAFLDKLKKHIFYGASFNRDASCFILAQELKATASILSNPDFRMDSNRSERSMGKNLRTLHGLISLLTVLKDDGMSSKALLNLKDELGDLEWCKALLYDSLQLDEGMIRQQNIVKLRIRYGTKFSKKKALNRNLQAERKSLN